MTPENDFSPFLFVRTFGDGVLCSSGWSQTPYVGKGDLNYWSSWLHFLGAGFTSIGHHIWFKGFFFFLKFRRRAIVLFFLSIPTLLFRVLMNFPPIGISLTYIIYILCLKGSFHNCFYSITKTFIYMLASLSGKLLFALFQRITFVKSKSKPCFL